MELDENLIRHMILNSIRSFRKKFKDKYGELVVVSDGMNNWRYDVFPQYKHKRKDTRKESDIDWKELFRITNLVYEELDRNFPYKVIKHDRCEADDVIATLVYNTQEFGQYEPVLIISGDKDFAQLQKFKNVAQYSPMQKKFIVEKNPGMFLLEHIMKGDQADGIPNVLSGDDTFVEGIRQKTLRKKALEELMENSKALGEEVERNIERNRKLIDLSSTPNQYKAEIINTFTEMTKSINGRDIIKYLISNRCKQLIEAVGDFI